MFFLNCERSMGRSLLHLVLHGVQGDGGIAVCLPVGVKVNLHQYMHSTSLHCGQASPVPPPPPLQPPPPPPPNGGSLNCD